MKRRTPIRLNQRPVPPLTAAELDAALDPRQDAILPSSGFADSVMTALDHEAAAPAPIPFPWRRALPGIAAAALTILAILAAMVFILRTATPSIASGFSWQPQLMALLHHGDALWLLLALAVTAACLLLCRRLLAAH